MVDSGSPHAPVLYHFDASLCGAKVRLTLAEKGVAYEERVVSGSALRAPSYLALNPNAVVPTFVHNEGVIVESSVIMTYIDNAFPGPALTPAAPLARAAMELWLKGIDETYFPAMGFLTYAVVGRRRQSHLSADERRALYEVIEDPVRRDRRRQAVEFGLEAPMAASALAQLGAMLGRAERALASTPYLVGSTYSLADAALTPFVQRLNLLLVTDQVQANRPALRRWWAAVRERPSFDNAIAARTSPTYREEFEQAARAHRNVLEAALG